MRLVLFFLVLTGCAAWRLRPDNHDHAARKAEVVRKMGVAPPKVDALLKADEATCDALDNKQLTWTIIGLAAPVIIPVLSTVPQDSTAAHWSVAGVSIGIGIVGAVAAGLAPHYAVQYTHRCTINTGGQ